MTVEDLPSAHACLEGRARGGRKIGRSTKAGCPRPPRRRGAALWHRQAGGTLLPRPLREGEGADGPVSASWTSKERFSSSSWASSGKAGRWTGIAVDTAHPITLFVLPSRPHVGRASAWPWPSEPNGRYVQTSKKIRGMQDPRCESSTRRWWLAVCRGACAVETWKVPTLLHETSRTCLLISRMSFVGHAKNNFRRRFKPNIDIGFVLQKF